MRCGREMLDIWPCVSWCSLGHWMGASVPLSVCPVPTTEGNTATVPSELYTISCSICQKLGIEFVYLLSTQMH